MGELAGETVPVIDLFAGPGGLGEGFSSFKDASGKAAFDLALSIEKDDFAIRTLRLRAFVRWFDRIPTEYYEFARNRPEDQIDGIEHLFQKYPEAAEHARRSVLQATLGRTRWATVFGAIDRALDGRTGRPWALIGGPPCQAYSLVGRARMKGHTDSPERARLHKLYRHYLQILNRYRPPVFVMENVKGLLSAQVDGQPVFQKIVRHLEGPHKSGVSYEVLPLVISQRSAWDSQLELWNAPKDSGTRDHRSFLIRSEDFGIPQNRHRVIVLGVEQQLFDRIRPNLPGLVEAIGPRIGVAQVIGDLPRIRSGESKRPDSDEAWRITMAQVSKGAWLSWLQTNGQDAVAKRVAAAMTSILDGERLSRGGACVSPSSRPAYRPDWFADDRLPGACNHESRAHIESDLARYLFAACFAEVRGRSPRLSDFPPQLQPEHENVPEALKTGLFSDRFRVQLQHDAAGRAVPATTITSHISKDGHYFIHYDPTQCRSLTVREAARIQTFPDNYLFLGPRTEQYKQVGNAVPPLLAFQIAEVVADILAPQVSVMAKGPAATTSRR